MDLLGLAFYNMLDVSHGYKVFDECSTDVLLCAGCESDFAVFSDNLPTVFDDTNFDEWVFWRDQGELVADVYI